MLKNMIEDNIINLYRYETILLQQIKQKNWDNVTMIEEVEQDQLEQITPQQAKEAINWIIENLLAEQTTSTETMILNQISDNLPAKRAIWQLLKIALHDPTHFLEYLTQKENRQLSHFLDKNYFENILILSETCLNFSYILDHAELFLGMLSEQKQQGKEKEYEHILSSFLYLYPELKKEREQELNLLPFQEKNAIILASRYRALADSTFLDYKTYELLFLDYPFLAAAIELFHETKKEQTIKRNDITSIYMNSFLFPLSTEQLESAEVNYYYRLSQIKKKIQLSNYTNANQLIHHIFQKNLQKKKSL